MDPSHIPFHKKRLGATCPPAVSLGSVWALRLSVLLTVVATSQQDVSSVLSPEVLQITYPLVKVARMRITILTSMECPSLTAATVRVPLNPLKSLGMLSAFPLIRLERAVLSLKLTIASSS